MQPPRLASALFSGIGDTLLAALRSACRGVETHVVGGSVRDAALGRTFDDVDLVAAGDGERLASAIAAAVDGRLVRLGGDRFAAWRIVAAAATIDLWDRELTTLDQDLARRDLTVDSIAVDLATGAVHDPFGGLEDLQQRRLRWTTPQAFALDSLRVLRLVRLAATLGSVEVEAATFEGARRAISGLASVAGERVREELEKLLGAPSQLPGFDLLVALGLYPSLLAGGMLETRSVGAVRQRLARAPRRRATVEALTGTAIVRPALLHWAVLLGGALRATASRPAAELAERLAHLRRRGLLTRRRGSDLAALLATPPPGAAAAARRRFLHAAGSAWPTAICLYGCGVGERRAVAWQRNAAALARLAARHGNEIFDPVPLLTGRDLEDELGIPPGPRMGELLHALLDRQIAGTLRDREQALDWLRGQL